MPHDDLAAGRWQLFPLALQLGHVGSEISRALRAEQSNDKQRMFSALDRALELFDLTIADPKNRGRLKEICRAREVICDYFFGDNMYGGTGESFNRYFTAFAIAAKR